MLKKALCLSAAMAAISLLDAAGAGAVTITQSESIQLINVCSDTGTGCGLTGGALPLDFIQTLQNTYAQAGISVSVLPAVNQLNNSKFQILDTADPNFSSSDCNFATTLPSFCALSRTAGNKQNTNQATLNVYVVNQIKNGTGITYGISWVNANGVALSQQAFAATNPGPAPKERSDTLAHEVGHNLGLDHTTFGNSPSPTTNLETAGATRTVPTSPTQAGTTLDLFNPTQTAAIKASPFLTGVPLVDVTSTDSSGSGACVGVQCDHIHVAFDGAGGSPTITLKSLFINANTASEADLLRNLALRGSIVMSTGIAAPTFKILDGGTGGLGLSLEFDFSNFAFSSLNTTTMDLNLFSPTCGAGCNLSAGLIGSRIGFLFSNGFKGTATLEGPTTLFTAALRTTTPLDGGDECDDDEHKYGCPPPNPPGVTGTANSNNLIIDPTLTGYFGQPNDPPINTNLLDPNPKLADIDPDSLVFVPEPSSLLLLLTGLLAWFACWFRIPRSS